MFPRRAAVINLLAGAALAGCLALVFAYDRNHAPEPAGGPKGGGQESAGGQQLEVRIVRGDSPPPRRERKRLRLAVVSPEGKVWDDMGKLLGELGEGYKFL